MHFDVTIVGGGMVGAGLAAALRGSHLKVALIDARLPSNNDPRLFALNHACCQFLENLTLWPALKMHAAPIHQVHISHQGHFGAVRLKKEDASLSSLGHVIPAHHIESALNKDLLSHSDITVIRPVALTSLVQQDDVVMLKVSAESGEKIMTSSIVIGADGTQSTVRALSNITTSVFDYAQSALVTRTNIQRHHNNIAYERFNKHGAIAMLPLPGNECATIWTASNGVIDELMTLTDDNFVSQLQNEFGYRVGRLGSVTERYVFPLRKVTAEKAVHGRVMLLGNSAHTLHPIAAQGFNLAMYEVAVLVDVIMEKHHKGMVFMPADLQVVSKRIQEQQKTSIGLSHQLTQLFSGGSNVMNWMSQIGMVSLDAIVPAKRKFIERMTGRSGLVPRLLS